jgi:two-component system, NarL family, sensor kinase
MDDPVSAPNGGHESQLRERLGRALILATLVMLVVSLAILGRTGWDGGHVLVFTVLLLPAPFFVGTMICLRRPSSLVGLFLIGHSALVMTNGLAGVYAYAGLIHDPGSLPAADWAALWVTMDWPIFYAGLVAAVLVFPDGSLPSPSWRPVAVGVGAVFLLLLAWLAVYPEPLIDPFGAIERPLPVLPENTAGLGEPLQPAALAMLFVAAWSVRVRFRNADGVERLQLLWITYGALFIPGALAVCVLDQVLTGGAGPLTGIAVATMALAVPGSIGIAILRHGLFDIELVLSRALLYAGLTGCVVLVYVALVEGLSSLIGAEGVLGLVATGIVAVGIQPLRQRLQVRINRWIYGDRDDPYAALSRLGDRLQATLAPEAIARSIVETVAEALRASFVAIEFERDGELEEVASLGERNGGAAMSTPLVYQGREIGRLVVEPSRGRELAAADHRLLADLARQAGVALHGVRLTSDLQASRRKLVAAREEERRRLRRDLHDSLGPALAGMAFRLDAAHNLIDEDPEEADRVIRELREETQSAIADIRRVAHQLRPPALDQLGLVSAIRAFAEGLSGKHGLRVEVRSSDHMPNLPAAVEVAAYRIVLESLTNVARHAGADGCEVEVTVNGELRLSISDDGIGLDDSRPAGVGLASMRERTSELGGKLEVSGRNGRGTRVVATLPLEER